MAQVLPGVAGAEHAPLLRLDEGVEVVRVARRDGDPDPSPDSRRAALRSPSARSRSRRRRSTSRGRSRGRRSRATTECAGPARRRHRGPAGWSGPWRGRRRRCSRPRRAPAPRWRRRPSSGRRRALRSGRTGGPGPPRRPGPGPSDGCARGRRAGSPRAPRASRCARRRSTSTRRRRGRRCRARSPRRCRRRPRSGPTRRPRRRRSSRRRSRRRRWPTRSRRRSSSTPRRRSSRGSRPAAGSRCRSPPRSGRPGTGRPRASPWRRRRRRQPAKRRASRRPARRSAPERRPARRGRAAGRRQDQGGPRWNGRDERRRLASMGRSSEIECGSAAGSRGSSRAAPSLPPAPRQRFRDRGSAERPNRTAAGLPGGSALAPRLRGDHQEPLARLAQGLRAAPVVATRDQRAEHRVVEVVLDPTAPLEHRARREPAPRRVREGLDQVERRAGSRARRARPIPASPRAPAPSRAAASPCWSGTRRGRDRQLVLGDAHLLRPAVPAPRDLAVAGRLVLEAALEA